jgi:hypothetical protein
LKEVVPWPWPTLNQAQSINSRGVLRERNTYKHPNWCCKRHPSGQSTPHPRATPPPLGGGAACHWIDGWFGLLGGFVTYWVVMVYRCFFITYITYCSWTSRLSSGLQTPHITYWCPTALSNAPHHILAF